jgi:type II secretory pathway component GspD/PulD (secretin)
MKAQTTVLILALISGGLTALAQANNPDQPAAAPAAPAAAPAVNPNEPVPLIVIEDVPLPDAIRNLARQANLNFQFDPRITATNQPNISIRFENVSPMEALLAVLDNYDMQLVRDPRFKIARVTPKDPKAEEPLITRIIQLKYCDATNMVSLLKPILPPRSQVLADPRTGQILLTTTEKAMEAAIATINQLDTPTKQVLIEAKIFETAKNPSTIKGINWAGTLEAQRVQLGNNAVGGILTSPQVLADTSRGGFGFNPAVAFLNADGVSAVFSFLNKDSDTEVLATPRAVTLDNQTAVLSVTRAYPIFQITPGSANSPAGASIIYTNLGTILYVTPRIAADKNISLKVVPEVSNIDSKDTQIINGAQNQANVYAIRKIETSVMIPSGHTLVMGGLLNDTSTRSRTKVPMLGDAPGVGWFFRSSAKTRTKQNLLIFVTPTIVEDDAFQQTTAGAEFLQTKAVTPNTDEEWKNPWNSAKPHDWTAPVY